MFENTNEMCENRGLNYPTCHVNVLYIHTFMNLLETSLGENSLLIGVINVMQHQLLPQF